MVTTRNSRVQRESREELNVGPECRSATTSLLMTINLSESGSFRSRSPPLAALLTALAVFRRLASTCNIRHEHRRYSSRSSKRKKSTIYSFLERVEAPLQLWMVYQSYHSDWLDKPTTFTFTSCLWHRGGVSVMAVLARPLSWGCREEEHVRP